LKLDANQEFQQAKADGSTSTVQRFLSAIGLATKPAEVESNEVGEVPTADSSLDAATTIELNEAIELAPFVDVLKKKLRVEPVRESRASFKDTRLIDINFQSSNPKLAAIVVNGIAETFTRVNQEKRSGSSKKTNTFLEDRVAGLQSQIKTDELKLAELKRSSGILSTGEGEQTIVIDRLSGLNKQLLEVENQRKNAEAQYNAVKDSPEKIRALSEESMARYITERENDIRALTNDTNKKIAELKAERAKLLVEYVEGAPEIQEYDKRINALSSAVEKAVEQDKKDLEKYRTRVEQTILGNLQTRFEQARDQEEKIRADFKRQYDQAQGQNQATINIRLLQQNVDTNRGFLQNLEKQQSQNDVIARGTDNNVSVVDIAIPPDIPIAPRRLTTVGAVFLLSTLFGLGLALFLEYLDDTIRTTEEVETFLQLPALAAIPTIDSMTKRRLLLVGTNDEPDTVLNSELLINADSRSSLAEAYRQLRTSILLSTAGHAPKSLLVTSSLPSEGKTTTAVNTAISLAQTGAKVLLIDADLRRPRLHTVFGRDNNLGLSTVLSSELTESEISKIIKFDETTKLDLLVSGPVPPNPAELIGSDQMVKLLQLLQKHFTHVVIDSPPIASFTDGVLIASMVDGVILVVQSGKSSRNIVRRSRQLLQEVGAKVFGVVLNNANLRSQDNYYYYQSYYHSSHYDQDDGR
jgi:capsular exopolysaccharide synthesis family protein